MPGFLLHQGATVNCMHGGTATPTVVSPNVFVDGMPVTMQPYPYAVAGCGLAPDKPFCVAANWITAATKVFVNGIPVLLFDSQATCPAPGTGVIVSWTQTKVSGV